MLAMLMQPNDFHLLILRLQHNLLSKKNMEKCTVFAFLGEDFITAVRHKLRELKRTTRRQPHRCALEVYPQERPTRHCVLLSLEYFSEKVGVNCWALHMPEVEDFPLLDAFSLWSQIQCRWWSADEYCGWAAHHSQHCEAVR
ncbi:retrotransposon hot spot (RHS) protein [Trypanosoma cruzi]|nr:retrotransposon hot spot (RHS) protein [Trypanosoma cruzi]